jgi:hypothetical protein
LFLYLLIAFFATVAGLHSGGGWRTKINWTLRTETSASVVSLRDDMSEIGSLWDNARTEVKKLQADVAADSRIAARHISTLIRTI